MDSTIKGFLSSRNLNTQKTESDERIEELEKQNASLEAKLAKAVDALGDMEKVPRSEASTGILKVMIRYTIAELKGEQP